MRDEMSGCGVCLYSDASAYDGTIDSVSVVVADKNLRCCECGQVVPKGAHIELAEMYTEEDSDEWPLDENDEPIEPEDGIPIYTCLVCAEIAKAFYCEGDGRIYGGELWDAMYEVFEGLTTSCFDRLTTPAAKAELQRRWMQWKGIR